MNKCAIRGSILSFSDDPFVNPAQDCVDYIDDGMVVTQEGRICELGSAADIEPGLTGDVHVDDCSGSLVLPGFIDCHVHYPQVEIVGAGGKQLMDWLNEYTCRW